MISLELATRLFQALSYLNYTPTISPIFTVLHGCGQTSRHDFSLSSFGLHYSTGVFFRVITRTCSYGDTDLNPSLGGKFGDRARKGTLITHKLGARLFGTGTNLGVNFEEASNRLLQAAKRITTLKTPEGRCLFWITEPSFSFSIFSFVTILTKNHDTTYTTDRTNRIE